jgi:REP element-mobilizing transposase RayT
MHRGIERRTIFTGAHDYRRFLNLLGETVERYRIRVHAYCLLDNHYHAILQTPDANLSRAMQWLGISYSSWFNARYDRVGPLFQGRFKSVPVEEGSWVQELSIYVHLNPVRTDAYGLGKIVRSAESQGLTAPPTREEVTARLKKLREYRWSSYRTYAGYESGPDWLTSQEILRRSARKVAERSKSYRSQLQRILSHGEDGSRMEQFRDVVGIGSAQFIERIRQRAGAGDRETERRGRLRDRISFKDVVHAVESLQGEPAKDWLHLRGDWRKWMVLKLARQFTGLTLSQLGEEMGGMDYAAVGMGLGRFKQRIEKDRRLQKHHRQATRMLNVKM